MAGADARGAEKPLAPPPKPRPPPPRAAPWAGASDASTPQRSREKRVSRSLMTAPPCGSSLHTLYRLPAGPRERFHALQGRFTGVSRVRRKRHTCPCEDTLPCRFARAGARPPTPVPGESVPASRKGSVGAARRRRSSAVTPAGPRRRDAGTPRPTRGRLPKTAIRASAHPSGTTCADPTGRTRGIIRLAAPATACPMARRMRWSRSAGSRVLGARANDCPAPCRSSIRSVRGPRASHVATGKRKECETRFRPPESAPRIEPTGMGRLRVETTTA